jgi:cell division protein FtsB
MFKRKKINIFRCIFIIIFLAFLITALKQEMILYRLHSEIETTKVNIKTLTDKKARLEEERQQTSDPRYVEKIARDEYNMVKKEEIPVFVRK